MPVMYSGCLGDWYTGLGAETLVPKKYFKFSSISCVFRNWSNYFKMTQKTKMQTEDKRQ